MLLKKALFLLLTGSSVVSALDTEANVLRGTAAAADKGADEKDQQRELGYGWKHPPPHGFSCHGPHGWDNPHGWDKKPRGWDNPCSYKPGAYLPSSISPKHFVQCGAWGECFDGKDKMCMGKTVLGENVWCPSVNACQHACLCEEYKHHPWMCPGKKGHGHGHGGGHGGHHKPGHGKPPHHKPGHGDWDEPPHHKPGHGDWDDWYGKTPTWSTEAPTWTTEKPWHEKPHHGDHHGDWDEPSWTTEKPWHRPPVEHPPIGHPPVGHPPVGPWPKHPVAGKVQHKFITVALEDDETKTVFEKGPFKLTARCELAPFRKLQEDGKASEGHRRLFSDYVFLDLTIKDTTGDGIKYFGEGDGEASGGVFDTVSGGGSDTLEAFWEAYFGNRLDPTGGIFTSIGDYIGIDGESCIGITPEAGEDLRLFGDEDTACVIACVVKYVEGEDKDLW